MSVSRDEVEHIAQLASLAVDEESLRTLTEQIGQILDYVAQLDQVDSAAESAAFRPGPAQAPLRPDEVNPTPMTLNPEDMAPEFEQGFFVVPRVRGLGEG